MRLTSIDGDCHSVGRSVGAGQWAGQKRDRVRNAYLLSILLLCDVEVDVASLLVELKDGGDTLVGLQDRCILTCTNVVRCKPCACGNVGFVGGDG